MNQSSSSPASPASPTNAHNSSSQLDTSVIRELQSMEAYSAHLRQFIDNQRQQQHQLEQLRHLQQQQEAEAEKKQNVPDQLPTSTTMTDHNTFFKSPHPLPFLTPETLKKQQLNNDNSGSSPQQKLEISTLRRELDNSKWEKIA